LNKYPDHHVREMFLQKAFKKLERGEEGEEGEEREEGQGREEGRQEGRKKTGHCDDQILQNNLKSVRVTSLRTVITH
jgi:predicted transposase YdaD